MQAHLAKSFSGMGTPEDFPWDLGLFSLASDFLQMLLLARRFGGFS